MTALFPSSFDSSTNGHLDVAERVYATVDRLIIGVGTNPTKHGLTAPEERVRPIRETTGYLGGVEVILLRGATMDETPRLGATLIVRGMRSSIDVNYEVLQAVFNREIGDVDTWWTLTRPTLAHISSSTVYELAGPKEDIFRYVPPAIERFLTDNRG